jgi:hypothetical protein
MSRWAPVIGRPNSSIGPRWLINGTLISPCTGRLQQLPKPCLNGGFDLMRSRIPGIMPIWDAEMTGDAVPFCDRPPSK